MLFYFFSIFPSSTLTFLSALGQIVLLKAGKVLKELIPNVMIDLACLPSRTRSVLKYMVKRNDFQSSIGNHPITNGKCVSILLYRHRGPVAIQ
jgi:hypothetical protein